MGLAAGPVIAGCFFYRAPNVFFGTRIAATVSIIFVAFMVPESKPDQAAIEASYRSESTEKAHPGGLFKALFSRPRLMLLALCITFFSFSYSQSLFALPLYTTRLFGEAGATLYGSMMSLNAVVVVCSNAFIVMILRKDHPLRNIALGILYAIGFACMGFATIPVVFYLLTVIFTFLDVVDATNTHYYIANNTPMSHRARFNTILPVIMGFGHGLAPLIGGQISARHGLSVLWILVGATALVVAAVVFLLYLTEPRKMQ